MRMSHTRCYGETIPDRQGNNQCKGLELGESLAVSSSGKKARMFEDGEQRQGREKGMKWDGELGRSQIMRSS